MCNAEVDDKIRNKLDDMKSYRLNPTVVIVYFGYYCSNRASVGPDMRLLCQNGIIIQTLSKTGPKLNCLSASDNIPLVNIITISFFVMKFESNFYQFIQVLEISVVPKEATCNFMPILPVGHYYCDK